jgi:hypothetical protein
MLRYLVFRICAAPLFGLLLSLNGLLPHLSELLPVSRF